LERCYEKFTNTTDEEMTELFEFKNEEAKECFTKMIRHYKQSFR